MDPLHALFALEKLGVKFGLENIRALSNALGRPQESFRSLLVAGTNGKGSVAAMAERALRAGGLRVARYTSPHLIHLEERFLVHGRPVEHAALREAAGDLQELTERLVARGDLAHSPTFFEVTTAMAFELFRRAGVEVAVLEVGLGGRLDATNVVNPVAGAITSIDLDHQDLLGSTLAEIAFEKAGIIKPGGVIVSGERKPEADRVIAEACRMQGATLVRAHDGTEVSVRLEEGRTWLGLRTPLRDYGTIPLALRGRHQAANAVVAVRLLEALAPAGVDLSVEAVAAGLGDVEWPGRLEPVALFDDRLLLLDAAHNPAGARALAAYVLEVYPGGLPFVFAAMEDKDVRGMLAALAPVARQLVMTRPAMARAMPPAALVRVAHEVAPEIDAVIEPEPGRAIVRALDAGGSAGVTGSIFLIGEVRALLERAGPAGAR